MESAVPIASQTNSSDYYDDDSQFLEALNTTVLPGDVPICSPLRDQSLVPSQTCDTLPPTQPSTKRRRDDFQSPEEKDGVQIPSEDEVYGPAHFGDFGEYMRRKRAKLQIQNSDLAQSRESGIFKGLSIYVNGWTRPSVQHLRQMIVQHGGVFQAYLTKKSVVTHIITCSLTPAKIREFKHMKVVRPEWLTESIKNGKLLSWKDFKYVHQERIEPTQGAKSNQESLLQATKSAPSTIPPVDPLSNTTPLAFKHPVSAELNAEEQHSAHDSIPGSDPCNKGDQPRLPSYAADESNPNAKRAMANPEWRKAHTSVSTDFIDGYYKNSRLHHLSTWKSELKNLVQEAQERAESGSSSERVGKIASEQHEGFSGGLSMKGSEFVMRSPKKWKGKERATGDEDRVIMHCDFDCFFVSAGLVSRPELKGKPVVVCHSQGSQGGASSTSEIASASYEARGFGIKNGMSLQQARQLCPDIITIPYEFDRYKEYSLKFYTVLMAHADDLQAVSVDEALIDVTTAVNQLRVQSGAHNPAKDFAEIIRAQVHYATKCEISIGISHNILLARLATRRAKPAGSYHLLPENIPEIMAPLQISDLHGFGWSTKRKAQEKLGVITLGELAKKSKGVLIEALGKATGETLYNAIRGVDDKKLESDKPRKSVSCEINYGIRFENNEQAESFIRQMATEVKKRLDAINMVGRSITLKIMKRDPTAPVEPPKFLGHGACDLFNKQMPLIDPGGKATSDAEIIGNHACKLLKSFHFDPKELRGIGIQVQKLESCTAAIMVPQGQALLPFKSKTSSSTDASNTAGYNKQTPERSSDAGFALANPTTHTHADFDLPSFSQVDMSVFEALPRDVREELETEYKRRSASPFTSAGPIGDPMKSLAPQQVQVTKRRSVTPSVFPQKPEGRGSNYKRIAQQLAPRTGASVSPQKSSIYTWAKKLQEKKKPTGVRITNVALRDLNLDPDVFFMLPLKVQREQLVRARLIKQKGAIPEPPPKKKILKPRKHELPPDFVPYRAPKPKANHPPPPFLRQQGPNKGEKLYFTETDDIQAVVEKWVMAYRHWAPRNKDVEFLSKFLVQSVDRSKATDVGVERAVAVMKWWMVLLRRFFPTSEYLDEDDLACSQRDTVGEAWWDALYGVQDEMDNVTAKRFGGRLSYK
ncbi:DNA repair protein rev1 [Psilocybe cubensis]|uniref:DNA repair protein REV1 n=2 Tax=Psilocybe cubensis TaxID=181762 RepID=A0A8H8CN40_PSICU|nr:DNA repair protein rev1 [Psilocybe cubensis]KAH9484056.1 DNA repair protein rev1 [Psilocybe cubensis]